ARRRAPRHPGGPSHPGKGHAYRTIKWINVERWPNRATFAIGATDWGFYLNFHETGTYKMPARPWLRPALDAVGARAVQEAGDVARGQPGGVTAACPALLLGENVERGTGGGRGCAAGIGRLDRLLQRSADPWRDHRGRSG